MNDSPPFVQTPRRADRLQTLTSFLVLATAPTMLESAHWTLALAAHFRPYLLVAWVICGAAHLLSARFTGGTIAMVTSVFLLMGLQVDAAPQSSDRPDLEVMQVNVQMNAQDTSALVEYIRAEDPDVVSLVEIDQRWVDALTSALDYPHVQVHPRPDFLGLAVLSRYPLRTFEVHDLTPGIPASTATIAGPEGEITLTTLHVLPPVRGEWARSQEEGLEELARERARHGARWVVCGDFNATPWSRAFRRFVAQSGLAPAPTSGWFSGTWPAGLPLVGLPIDHCLLAPGVRLVSAETGPALSGDHRPISVSLDTRIR